MASLFVNMEERRVAEGLVQGSLYSITKKGQLKDCANYRTISLISHASKILLRIIIKRMKNKLDQEISSMQAGFREGRGTRDQIVNIRIVMEKCRDHKLPLYMGFIDYSKAFDWLVTTKCGRLWWKWASLNISLISPANCMKIRNQQWGQPMATQSGFE